MTTQCKKSFSLSRIGLATIAAFAFQSLSTQAAVLVEWGGGTDIVTSNQPSGTPSGTYTSGNTVTPAVSASYYPNNTGKNPSFNGAVTGGGSLEVWNGGGGDFYSYPRFSNPGQTTTALSVWEGGLHMTPSGQGQLDKFLISGVSMRNGPDTGTIRFVFEQNDSDWYISDPFAFTGSGNNFLFNAGEANWYDYTPLSVGSDIIGAPATPSLDYTAVGFRSEVTRDAGSGNSWSGVRVSNFAVTTGTIPEPSVMSLLGVSFAVLFAARRTRRG